MDQYPNQLNLIGDLSCGIISGTISTEHMMLLESINNDIIVANRVYKPAYRQFYWPVSLTDPRIQWINESVLQILGNNYKTRDTFAVETVSGNLSSISGHAGKWHTDYAGSFALMILMNDITLSDTHMEFVPYQIFNPGLRWDTNHDEPTAIKCIGQTGTMFLFNNGHFKHRMKLLNGCNRKTIHSIFLPKNIP